jgi:hypothetical protein
MSIATATADAGQTAAEATERVWDMLVIGGGSAGLVRARTAASFGASVLLVERDRPGGDCLWTGCVPSKVLLLAAAGATTAARTATRFGIREPQTRGAGQGRADGIAVTDRAPGLPVIQRAAMGRRTTMRVVARAVLDSLDAARGLTRPLGQCSTVEG